MKARPLHNRDKKFTIGDKISCIRPIDGLEIGFESFVESTYANWDGYPCLELSNGYVYSMDKFKKYFRKV